MMFSAVAFQMKDLGSVFQCSAQPVMAVVRSAPLMKTPRRRRWSVRSLNQRSRRFSQELEMGMKCRCQRRRSLWASHFLIAGALGRRGCPGSRGPTGSFDGGVDLLEEGQNIFRRVPFAQVGLYFTGRDVHRREQVDRAVALVAVRHRPGPGHGSSAATAGSGPGPGRRSSHRRRTPPPRPADSDTARPPKTPG